MSIATIVSAVKQSFVSSIGDIVFGMEDGTVSIFGLVFGVVASTSNGKAVLPGSRPTVARNLHRQRAGDAARHTGAETQRAQTRPPEGARR